MLGPRVSLVILGMEPNGGMTKTFRRAHGRNNPHWADGNGNAMFQSSLKKTCCEKQPKIFSYRGLGEKGKKGLSCFNFFTRLQAAHFVLSRRKLSAR